MAREPLFYNENGELVPARRQPAAPAKPPPGGKPAKSPATAARFQTLNAFVDVWLRDCTGAEAAVWFTLWRDERGGKANVSQVWLGERTGHNRVTVTRALQALERKGLVRVLRRGGIGRGSSTYQTTLPR